MSIYEEIRAKQLGRIEWALSALDNAKLLLKGAHRATCSDLVQAQSCIQEAVEYLTGQNDGGR